MKRTLSRAIDGVKQLPEAIGNRVYSLAALVFSFMSFSQTNPSSAPDANARAAPNLLATLFFAATVGLFVAVRLWRLAASCLWFDEIFSVHAAHHGWAELLRFVAADIIHPPLFYLLLKLWISVGGESLLWLRLLPALFSIAAIVPFLLLCGELELSRQERNLALLLLAVNGYLIKYAQELRMYSLLMFLSLCSLWLFIKFFRTETGPRKQIVCLFLANFLLVYAHYAGWILVALECVALLIWQRRQAKLFLAAIGITAITFAPWVFLVRANAEAGKGLAQNIGWMTRPTLRDITQFYALLNKPFWFVQSTAARPFDLLTAAFAILVVGSPLLFLVWQRWRANRHANKLRLRALWLFTLAPVAIVFGLSWLLPQSVWGTRHLIIVAAPYAILVALGIVRLPQNWLRLAVCLILGSWFLIAGVAWALDRPPTYIWCAWEPLARQVEASDIKATPEAHVYAFEDLVAYHLWFALDSSQRRKVKVSVIKGVAAIPEDPAYFLPRRFNDINVMNGAAATEDEIWIAFRAPRWDETLPPLSTLENSGYRVTSAQSIAAQGQQAFMVRLTRK